MTLNTTAIQFLFTGNKEAVHQYVKLSSFCNSYTKLDFSLVLNYKAFLGKLRPIYILVIMK
jgi:hypothetical protein